MGFDVADGVRQKFALKERDNETGLDYFLARYTSSGQGRFTSPPYWRSHKPKLGIDILIVLITRWPFVDPTGMWNWPDALGGDLTDDQLREQQREIAKDETFNPEDRQARIADISQGEWQQATNAINSYGTENDGNGVVVAVSKCSVRCRFTREENGKLIVVFKPYQLANSDTLWGLSCRVE